MVSTMERTPDTTRRTLVNVRRMPQWWRLIVTIHKAQNAAGYAGRHFGAEEMRHFGVTLIGKPVEKVARRAESPASAAREFAAYWVERHATTMGDGVTLARYVLKAVYGDNLAQVYDIAHTDPTEPTPEWDRQTAAEYVQRAMHQVGRAAR